MTVKKPVSHSIQVQDATLGKNVLPAIKCCYPPLLGFSSPSLLGWHEGVSISPINEGTLKQKISNCKFRETVVENIAMNIPWHKHTGKLINSCILCN